MAAALLLAASARADHVLMHNFGRQAACAGKPQSTVANYLGCINATSGGSPFSYDIKCINSTAFLASFYDNAACEGNVVYESPTALPRACVPGNATEPASLSVCERGSYVPPSDDINMYIFNAPMECPPVSTYYAVSSIPLGCVPVGGPSGGSLIYGCDALNVTGVPYSSSDCSGPPLSPPLPLQPLGCDITPYGLGPTVTKCGGEPPAISAAPAGAPAVIPAVFGARAGHVGLAARAAGATAIPV